MRWLGGRLEIKLDCRMDFQCQKKRISISHYTCCKLRDSARSWNLMETDLPKALQINQNRSCGHTSVVFLWFGECWDAPVVLWFWDRAKVVQKSTLGCPKGGQPPIAGRSFQQRPQVPGRIYILVIYTYTYIYIYIHMISVCACACEHPPWPGPSSGKTAVSA